MNKSFYILILIFTTFNFSNAQNINVSDHYLVLNALSTEPLYTTYTASMERSSLYGDKGYKMDYYSDCTPLNYSSDKGGRIYCTWRFNAVVVDKMSEYYKKPVVIASFPDMVILEYDPFQGIQVQETFMVYSSSIALIDMQIINKSGKDYPIDVYPVHELGNDSLLIEKIDKQNNGYVTKHYETLKRLVSSMRPAYPYPTHCRNFFSMNMPMYSQGGYSGSFPDFYNEVKRDFYAETNKHDSLNCKSSGYVNFVALHTHFILKNGEQKNVRYFRGWQDEKEDLNKLIQNVSELKTISLQKYIDEDIALFSKIPKIQFKTNAEKILYLSSFNLARGCMLPPEGQTKYNFYAFSREPLWGWGHGHQVLHESLSMMAYCYLDPVSAQNSQRVYMEQQGADGLIAYRHGPRGAQTYPHKDKPTTSAPFYSWINWEVYLVSKDRQFLKDAYESGSRYVDWLFKNRDEDHDGTFEWGPYGIIENVRDWYNAVFQVSADRHLDVDKEDISDELECLDLTLMVINEMRSLSEMARELGDIKAAADWKTKADKTSDLVNQRMWDKETRFYYSVNKKDHSFKFMTRDLRRQEIIAFLALWSQTATKERAAILVKNLTNPETFWRKYGVPTLSAKDVWYSPYVDYCCKWNGPVWLLWNYMVYDGLKKYGYKKEANELANKMILAATTQLSKNHNFWESFSPDNEVLNSPTNYIWDSILAKLLIDINKHK